jgi:tetratricopeptide (TPR) repeat protein
MKHYSSLFAGTISLFISFFANCAIGQTDPELMLMYHSAEQYRAEGNNAAATNTYNQLLRLWPGHTIARAHLALIYHAAADYNAEENILLPALTEQNVPDSIYFQLAVCQAANGKIKKARQTILLGQKSYPASGLMYLGAGMVEISAGQKDKALEYFEKGRAADSKFAPVIQALSALCADKKDYLWATLYGQTYLSMAHDTVGDQLLKNQLFASWRVLFTNLGSGGVNSLAAATHRNDNFTTGLVQWLEKLTPVVSEGVNTETLTMVTARLLIEMQRHNLTTNPLYSYQYKIMEAGLLDTYCEWLYGKAESEVENAAWNKFHSMDTEKLLQWMGKNKLAINN